MEVKPVASKEVAVQVKSQQAEKAVAEKVLEGVENAPSPSKKSLAVA